jgi:hypothetical protein
MIQFFSQMLKLPMEAFVFSMEMLLKTIQGIQKITYQGIDATISEIVQPPGDRPGSDSGPTSDVPDGAIGDSAQTTHQTTQEEERKMADKDLRDDMLKLVRYKILFVKRDYEHVFGEVEELVSDNTDAAAYTAWKIAHFIQRLGRDKDVKVPKDWDDYTDVQPFIEVSGNDRILTGLPEDDKKYLRVFYEVLDRYPRERFKYEEEQIDILKEISATLTRRERAAGGGAGGAGGPTGTGGPAGTGGPTGYGGPGGRSRPPEGED